MGRKKYSKEEQAVILARYRASGVSREEFSMREGVSKSALYRWERQDQGSMSKFVELPLNFGTASIELDLPHGIRLRIGR